MKWALGAALAGGLVVLVYIATAAYRASPLR